ncbi:Gp37 family protein, partial [Mannheimia haemolytica]
LDLLDKLRLLVVGFKPQNCGECWLIDEFFNGSSEETGLWQYQLILQTETQQVQHQAVENLPKFVTAHLRRQDQPGSPGLKT